MKKNGFLKATTAVMFVMLFSTLAFATTYNVGDIVVTATEYRGRIVAVYQDNTVDIQFGKSRQKYNWPIGQIKHYTVINSLGGFTVGDAVVNDEHSRGKIVALHANGTADILFDRGAGTYRWPLPRIKHVLKSLHGFSVGDIVVTEAHHRGTIAALYPDNTADILFDGTKDTHNWPIGRFHKFITCIGPDCAK